MERLDYGTKVIFPSIELGDKFPHTKRIIKSLAQIFEGTDNFKKPYFFGSVSGFKLLSVSYSQIVSNSYVPGKYDDKPPIIHLPFSTPNYTLAMSIDFWPNYANGIFELISAEKQIFKLLFNSLSDAEKGWQNLQNVQNALNPDEAEALTQLTIHHFTNLPNFNED